ncbi:MAG: nuclear transport factor 2 family protein [Gallionellaceae bacterium]|nr:nuclear transport factor 2 family protein [Gallionellaceae bacterium]
MPQTVHHADLTAMSGRQVAHSQPGARFVAPIRGDEAAPVDTSLGALAEFYRAFNGRDLDLMRQNWQQDECVLANPLGGLRRGWEEIEPLYARLFAGAARVWVEFYDYTLHEGGDLFVAAGRERGHFTLGDLRIDLAIRTSRTYRKSAGRWRQIHHHGSIEDPDLLARYQSAVMAGPDTSASNWCSSSR